MHCSECGADNRDAARFCDGCGAQLTVQCPSCGTLARTGARFCDSCGAALLAATSATPADNKPLTPLAGERRHLTVLFCDLVGSTEIAARLDPEEWREIVADYHRTTAEAIERFGGYVAQYLGDGVMAYFGWPEAHDNDAERAARAGLAILGSISKLNERSTQLKLSARVGIDSGGVVVGARAGREADVFGDTPNIAARVQTVGDPGTVLITADTHRLISGLFIVEDRGAQALKGIERPLRLYRVIQASGVRGRLEAAAARGLTPFVGREDELRLIVGRWERALDGEGQVVLIIGEAGIGKSRLVQHFHEQLTDREHTWLDAATAPFFQNTPFYPISELLRQLSGARADTTVEDQFAQLEPALLKAGLKPAEAIPLLAPLLNLPPGAKYPPSPLPPEQQRRRVLATIVEWVLGTARAQPFVIATEDLQWADPSTLELIQLLVEQGATARLLLLYTARPEFHAQWPLRAHHAQITLNCLSARNVREIIAQLAARNALASETVDVVIERTGGVPLFVEELTRAVLESGTGKVARREIPVTLHDSLMARLDRLGSAKEVAQVAAVIGDEFPYELLHAVHPMAEDNLQSSLRSLTDAELLYVRGIAPEATYRFKHALIRDAAYEALLKSRRKDLHRVVARTINEKFTSLRETHPEVLARHWAEAGETQQAILEWSRAGEAAQARNAFIEAQESLQQALALLNVLPESPERDVRELELRQSLVLMLQMTRGWAASETVKAAARIALLAEKSGNLLRLVWSMTTKCFHACIAGDLSTAAALADQALELALREGNPSAMAYLHEMQIVVHYYRGDLAGAENHFAAGLKFVDDPVFRQSPGGGAITMFGWASFNAWMLGRADVARERLAEMRVAVNPANPHDLEWSDLLAAFLHALMREYETVEALAAGALEMCEKHRFPNDAAYSKCFLGYARAQLGRAADGVSLVRGGIDALLQVGNGTSVSGYMTYLAVAQLRGGAIGDAAETVERALNFNPEEVVYRPETLRVRGEIRVKQGDLELAEADFRDSIAIARSMGAKAWELRTTMSLARLLRDTGRRDEARTRLAEIYNWFTEGFDTADLKEAKALLDEIGC
jgi:class 3 adenylate cyclase/tetratricopeptide (TPR) repeat protein